MKKKAKPEYVLCLRTCDAEMRSYGNFVWPKKGKAKAPDWSSEPTYGHGLHGLLWGEGCGDLLNFDSSAKWLVVRVRADKIVNLGGKVKFPEGTVVHCGDRKSATDYILANGAQGKSVVGAAVQNYGYRGTATAGDRGTATAGYGGTATAGDRGTATAGDRGTATAGYGGAATAGDGGAATAGDGGSLSIFHWNGSTYVRKVAAIGEGGIKAKVKYRLNESGIFVPAK